MINTGTLGTFSFKLGTKGQLQSPLFFYNCSENKSNINTGTRKKIIIIICKLWLYIQEILRKWQLELLEEFSNTVNHTK